MIFLGFILTSMLGFQFGSNEIIKAYGEPSKRIVGNFPEWRSEKIDDIEYSKVSDIMYFHIKPNSDGSLDTSDVNFNDLKKIRNKAHAAGVNVLIAIGGWESSDEFPIVAKDPELRANFVKNVEKFIIKNNLDGVDIDWETTINQEKIDNQDILLAELSSVLHPLGKLVTVSVVGNKAELKSTAADSVDWVNLMAFNMNDDSVHHSSFDDSIATLHLYESVGIPKEKLNLGIPFYGRHNEKGDEKSYEDIVSECYPSPSDEYCKGYFFNGIDMVKQKSRHVLHNGYGGIMIWSLAHDTNDQTSLLNAIYEIFPDPNLPEKKNPVITEVKKTSNGILVFWTQNEPAATSYDIFIDGIDTDGQYRTESSPQLVENGECFIVQARYSDDDLLSQEVCLDIEATPGPELILDKKIPEWVKNTMRWYVDGLTEEHEIISAIKFLINEKIIILN